MAMRRLRRPCSSFRSSRLLQAPVDLVDLGHALPAQARIFRWHPLSGLLLLCMARVGVPLGARWLSRLVPNPGTDGRGATSCVGHALIRTIALPCGKLGFGHGSRAVLWSELQVDFELATGEQ